MMQRRRGGIEPLRVSTPRELKSRPSTSPSHPGFRQIDARASTWALASSNEFPRAEANYTDKKHAVLCALPL